MTTACLIREKLEMLTVHEGKWFALDTCNNSQSVDCRSLCAFAIASQLAKFVENPSTCTVAERQCDKH